MDTQIIVVFCLCADMLKSLHHYEDRQCQMSDAEVMTTAIIAMLYFIGFPAVPSANGSGNQAPRKSISPRFGVPN
jgi:hypothetical protein